MTFRVSCPNCGSKAIVGTSKEVSKGIGNTFVKDLYCHCTNHECCGSFVVTVGFSRWITPPAATAQQLAMELIQSMPKGERDDLLRDMA